MNVWMGVLLALATTARAPYNGPNGLDPAALTVLVSGSDPLALDFENSGEFLDWLYADEDYEQRAEAVAYFIRCAFDSKVHVRIAPWPEWRGQYGLAPKTATRIQDLVTSTEKSGTRASINFRLDPEDGKWVSACLVALINQKGLHQVVSLRGNHPALSTDLPRASLDAARWTLGYPEGVFFADLLNFSDSPPPPLARRTVPAPPGPSRPAEATPAGTGMAAALVGRDPTLEEREQSFTIGLNVPTCVPPARTSPPNVPLGRTLDWRETTCDPSDLNCKYRIARRLGTREPAGPSSHLDPDHRASEICVKPGDDPQIVNCPPPASPDPVLRLRPLFVHLPRFIRIADVEVPDTGGAVNASLQGKLDPTQIRTCNADDCVTPFTQLWAGMTPSCAAPPGRPGLFAGLRDDQVVTATLRLLNGPPELPGLQIDPGQKFTALIRYRSKGPSRARVLVPSPKGGTVQWTPVEGALRTDPGFQWLQVYPVKPVVENGKTSLKIQLQGVPGGKGFPELDVVGFVPDRPWCLPGEPKKDLPLLVVCP